MPKSSRAQIDEDEKKVISEIRNNAKESIDNIAKKCGFSRQKVWRIIKRLEKRKVIWGYGAIIDEEKVNLKEYLVLIKRTNKPVDKKSLDMVLKRKISKELKKVGVAVEYSYFIHGVYDWFLYMTAEDIKHIKKFTQLFNTMFREYVLEFQILEVIFPVEKHGINNPRKEDLLDFFLNTK